MLADGIRDVVEAFRQEVGRAPALVELLEVLHHGARTLPDEALSDARPNEIIGFLEHPRARLRTIDAVRDLNDVAFVDASEAFNSWWQEVLGAPMTAAELGASVLGALREGGLSLSGEPAVATIESITPRLKRAKARARVGDIIAVPAGDGSHYLVVVICRNAFGIGFGLLRGRHTLPTQVAHLGATATGVAVYSDAEAIAGGRWRIVGHDDGLLAHFPADPEIYHRPQPPFPGLPPIGAFGAAETAGGRLRDIDEAEARRVDLLDTYQQSYLSETLAGELPALLARHGT